VERSRQGIERRITDDGLLAIEFARILNIELGVSVERAAEIVAVAMTARTATGSTFATRSGVTLHFPIAETERRLREHMVDALDAVGHIRRGRPRRRS
jgi:hypothetical protein